MRHVLISNSHLLFTQNSLVRHITSWDTTLLLPITTSNRKLKQRRRRRRGRRLEKNEFIFYQRNSWLSRFVRFTNGSKNVLKLNMQRRRSNPNENSKNQPWSSTFRWGRRTWSFHVVVSQRTAKKCTNARAQPLFFSINLLLGDVLVAVFVVICLSSLITNLKHN